MTQKMQRGFLAHYGLMLVLSAFVGFIAFMALDFAGSILSTTLVKNQYHAQNLLKDDYREIETSGIVENGGGVQVVNEDYQIVLSKGLVVFEKTVLTPDEFTSFLTGSHAVGVPYGHDIAYSSIGRYWLIVTFPTSLRIDFALAHNSLYPSKDANAVGGVIIAAAIFYLLLLSLAALLSSRLTAMTVTAPLQKLCQCTRRLKTGDYSTRVELKLKNEFLELQEAFNDMAQMLQEEKAKREQAEANRKQLVLDISHDLKNPLASILGYAEYGLQHPSIMSSDGQAWLKAIESNGQRANALITGLFELSKLESPEYRMAKVRIDLCEYLRAMAAQAINAIELAGFSYEFDLPDVEVSILADTKELDRVFQNLIQNALQYNPKGTLITLSLQLMEQYAEITFSDNGIGMAQALSQTIFHPFVRADAARNSKSGGTGLGLAIVEKIITLHGGNIQLKTAPKQGCTFLIKLPKA